MKEESTSTKKKNLIDQGVFFAGNDLTAEWSSSE
jgi:hypothetical protein